jgi:hypothetical protein
MEQARGPNPWSSSRIRRSRRLYLRGAGCEQAVVARFRLLTKGKRGATWRGTLCTSRLVACKYTGNLLIQILFICGFLIDAACSLHNIVSYDRVLANNVWCKEFVVVQVDTLPWQLPQKTEEHHGKPHSRSSFRTEIRTPGYLNMKVSNNSATILGRTNLQLYWRGSCGRRRLRLLACARLSFCLECSRNSSAGEEDRSSSWNKPHSYLMSHFSVQCSARKSNEGVIAVGEQWWCTKVKRNEGVSSRAHLV